ncbi:MAG: nitroreductase [Alphaproteobacteria bacterium]|nr:nitroreductase [Alphaproteobacteria bacterium]
MDAITALTTRASAFKLTEPAPSQEDLDTILAAAVRAPDHGRLRPWRFLCIRGAAREKLGRAMAEKMARDNAEANASMLARTAAKPLRAPLIIAVIGTVDTEHPKIPEIEQVLSAGSAAQNIMLAAYALGYGCMWKTGEICYDDAFKALLGVKPTDHIVGFMYLGTIDASAQMEIDRPDFRSLVSEWQ